VAASLTPSRIGIISRADVLTRLRYGRKPYARPTSDRNSEILLLNRRYHKSTASPTTTESPALRPAAPVQDSSRLTTPPILAVTKRETWSMSESDSDETYLSAFYGCVLNWCDIGPHRHWTQVWLRALHASDLDSSEHGLLKQYCGIFIPTATKCN